MPIRIDLVSETKVLLLESISLSWDYRHLGSRHLRISFHPTVNPSPAIEIIRSADAGLLDIFLCLVPQLLMLLLQLADLGLMNLARVHARGLHPLGIDILNIQIRADILLVDECPHSAHSEERPLILLGRTQILDLKVLVSRRANGLDIMQRAAGPDGVDAPGLVVLIPGAALVDPDGVADPLLAVLIERIRDVLLRRQGSNVLALDLLDDLQRVVAHVHQRAHDRPVLHRPVGPDERQEVGEVRHREPQVPLRAHLPFVGQVDAVLPDNREPGPVGYVEARRAHDRVDLDACAVFADHARFVDLDDLGEVDVHVGFLDRSVRRVEDDGLVFWKKKPPTYISHRGDLTYSMYGSPGVILRQPIPKVGVKPLMSLSFLIISAMRAFKAA